MESPFFRNHWNYYYPQNPRYVVPGTMEVPSRRRTVPVAPKVVSVPVRFVEPKKRSGSDSATKIQKVFRGFVVRRSVKKVVAIERDVDEIERRISDLETVDLIRKDAKERVKYGEMLMSLLFRLDSVKGVDPGIRNFRKAVIKKAIALQEKVDSIAAVDRSLEMNEIAAVDQSSEMNEIAAVERSSEMNDSGADEIPELEDGVLEHEDGSGATDDSCIEPADENVGVTSNPAIIEGSRPQSSEVNVDLEVPEADDLPTPRVSEHGAKNLPVEDGFVEKVAEAEQKIPEDVDNDMLHREIVAAMCEDESRTDLSDSTPNSEVERREEDSRMKGREEDGRSRELLERMMVDNKKAMEMMAQLVEKNELQSRLLNSLSQRVEQLEKALVYEMLRKKKRSNCVDCSEKSPKTKKSGK